MSPERLQRIEQLYHSACERHPEEREGFLQEACGGDTELLRAVRRLLEQDVDSGVMERPLLAVAAELCGESLPSGAMLGPYRIEGRIGAGGMGEVYKARDSRLNRVVAIKVLPADWLGDAGRRRRFLQEARAASALNHPNIVTLHDIASEGGRDYLVMEYVAGKTLDALIPRAGMRPAELFRIATQIAEGLSAAHAAGIIHRDLKPSNIMVTEGGLVKILDFGLAKLTEGSRSGAVSAETGLTETEPGMVMGTAAYMSPEQAEGKLLDARSDIFSFGAVLYEMATGRRAFAGESQAAIVSAVLHREPLSLSEAAPGVPQELDRLITRCLRKDPAKRQQHMADVKVLLEELSEERGSSAAADAKPVSGRRRMVWWGVVGAVVVTAAGAVLWWLRSREEMPARVTPITTLAGSESHASFSPDGNQVVFSWDGEKQENRDLWVKMIGSENALRLTTDAAEDDYPAWSPDGRQIAFLKSGERKGVYLISPIGGREQKVAEFDAAPAAPAWSPDGKFLVVAKNYFTVTPLPDAGTLFQMPVEGGEAAPFLKPLAGRMYYDAAFSPEGRMLAFFSSEQTTPRDWDLFVVELGGDWHPRGQPRRLTENPMSRTGISWTPDGRWLLYSEPVTGFLHNHVLFRRNVATGGLERLEIASQGATFPAVARQGNRVAFTRWTEDSDVWRLQAGGKVERLLGSSAGDLSGQYSPDGRRIAFNSGRESGRWAIWLANADGSGPFRLTSGPDEGSPRWSPDGKWIAFDARGKDRLWNIKVVDASGGQARQLTSGSSTNWVPSWSRDGKWIYFSSDRTGRFEIWRMPWNGGDAVQMTREGGHVALESPDRKALYYTKFGDHSLYSRRLDGGEEKRVLDRVVQRGFEVFDDGIYYLYADAASPTKSEIRFHEFATGRSQLVGSIDGRVFLYLSVAPDRKSFLFSMYDSRGADLMMIENFR